MTFPAYRPLLQCIGRDASFLCVQATVNHKIVGLAIARSNRDTAVLLSIYVLPEFRQQKIGGALLTFIEKRLRLRGCKRVIATYSSSVPGCLALEKLLKRRGWRCPVVRMMTLFTTRKKMKELMQNAIYYRYREPVLPRGFRLVKWQDLSDKMIAKITDTAYKSTARNAWRLPLEHQYQTEPLTSFAILKEDKLHGWILSHRISSNTIRYTIAHNASEQKGKRGLIIQAFAHAFWIHSQQGPERACFAIHATNQALLGLVQRRLIDQNLIESIAESRETQKWLLPS